MGAMTATALDVPGLLTDPEVKATYAVDATIGAVVPGGFEVVRAASVAEVVEVMRYADAHGVPVVPQGARTALTGAACAVEGGIVLNTEKLDAIEEIDPVQHIAVMGPGVVTGHLRRSLLERGLFYPPDPGSVDSCTIGGNVAMNAGGMCCVKYGVTADYVRGLEVVLPGGEILRTGRRTAKGVTGYDLTGLMVGSEGTLGVITKVITKVVAAPDPALTALATFDSLQAASEAIVALHGLRATPSLLEFLDAPSIAAIQALADFGFPEGCEAALLVQSDRVGHVAEDVALYAATMEACGATDIAVADDEAEAELLLAGRRSLNPALEAKGPNLIEDMCVPIARLADLVTGGRRVGDELGLEITMSGHGGDGNLHPSIFFDPTDADSTARAWQAFDALVELTLSLGGTIAGEHGLGWLKAPWLRREIGDLSSGLQRQVKAVFDPKGLMNPGRVFTDRTPPQRPR